MSVSSSLKPADSSFLPLSHKTEIESDFDSESDLGPISELDSESRQSIGGPLATSELTHVHYLPLLGSGDSDSVSSNSLSPLPIHKEHSHRPRLGNYELIKRLGGGAEAAVWKARELGLLGRVVALKLIDRFSASDVRRVERLRLEALRVGRLRSLGLLPVLDWGEAEGACFFSMPLVEGWNLSRVIDQRWAHLNGRSDKDVHPIANLDWEDYFKAVARLFGRIARALDEAHRHEIVHRDVKPSNILLDGQRPDEVYLADFGLSRDLETPSVLDMGEFDFLGTPAYMAPEKLRGLRGQNEYCCDLYSLGATLYEVVTCRKPRNSSDSLTLEARRRFLADQIPPKPRKICRQIPLDLQDIVLKAIEPDPKKRYAKPRDLAEDLDRFLEGRRPIATPRSKGFVRNLSRTSQRRPLLFVIATVALLLGVSVSAAVFQTLYNRQHEMKRMIEDTTQASSKSPVEDLTLSLADLIARFGKTEQSVRLADRIAERFLQELKVASFEQDYQALARLLPYWLKFLSLDSEFPVRYGKAVPSKSVRISSAVTGVKVSIRLVWDNGRPRGNPVLTVDAGSLSQPAEVSGLLPGRYWIRAYDQVDGGKFVERSWTLSAGPEPADLRIYIKSTVDLESKMVRVQGGTLKMGIDDQRYPLASPTHDRVVADFLLDDHEVTYGEYKKFLLDTQGEKAASQVVWSGPDSVLSQPSDWLNWSITNITHEQAVEYAAWRGCRLPSEEELEWACRGSSNVSFPKTFPKSSIDSLRRLRAFDAKSNDQSATVSNQPIHDLFGNASEWTLFDFQLYNGAPLIQSRNSHLGHTIRCGVWLDPKIHSDQSLPVILGYINRACVPFGSKNPYVGFRCARSVRLN